MPSPINRYARDLFEVEGAITSAGQSEKASGAYYTPDPIVRTLVSWVIRRPTDRLLDPACGDGRFLTVHANSVGVEQDPRACEITHRRAPGSLIHQGDFFTWASRTHERFECAAGNPPFIRYQRFTGPTRDTALELCRRHGATFSGLSSSWAPFLVATATLLKPGGRMAFVVPAEIGHAPYAVPVLEFLARNFESILVVAVREKLFPDLSEDCWLLYADGFGGNSEELQFLPVERFEFTTKPPRRNLSIRLSDWRTWNSRLRPFLLPARVRDLYAEMASDPRAQRLGRLARVGIGYVTGANDFFHFRPSIAERLGIPAQLLLPAVRSGRSLAGGCIDETRVRKWLDADEPVLLLALRPDTELPASVRRYLDSEAGWEARAAYKCRTRDPWYVVPDVKVPDGFLSYMSGDGPTLVGNPAGCVCTNSVHAVQVTGGLSIARLTELWAHPFTALSCEIEGHPLGGGMLKLEPREAANVLLADFPPSNKRIVDAIAVMKRWRHYGG